MARSKARRKKIAMAALACVCTLLRSNDARAQPSLELTWDAPSSCPDRATVLAGVKRLVTTSPPRTLYVTAVAHQEDERWVVELEMRGAASGTRTLRAATCASVARATSLIVALALDPQAAALASDDLAQAEPPAEEPPARPPPPPPPAAVSTSRTAPARPLVFVGGSAERALLPGLAPGATFGAGVVWRALRFDLAAQIATWASGSLDPLPAIGADFSLIAIAFRACAGRDFWQIAMHVCASVRGSRVSGEGTGLAESYRQTARLLSVEPSVLLRVPARTPAALELDVAAVLPMTRPDFVIARGEASDVLFRVSAIGARATLAGAYRF